MRNRGVTDAEIMLFSRAGRSGIARVQSLGDALGSCVVVGQVLMLGDGFSEMREEYQDMKGP